MCSIITKLNGEELHTIGDVRKHLGERWSQVFGAVDDETLADDDCLCHINVAGVLDDLNISYKERFELLYE